MRDVSDLLGTPWEGDGKVKHATGTHNKHRSVEVTELDPVDADGGTELPTELDERPDFGRES